MEVESKDIESSVRIDNQEITPKNKNLYSVLLVEDQESDAALLRRQLSESSDNEWTLHWVKTLKECVSHLKNELPQVILLDLGLPDSVGLDTLNRLKDYSGETPIVVLTGNADVDLGVSSIRMGAQDYLVKGDTNLEVLRRSLRFALERVSHSPSMAQSEYNRVQHLLRIGNVQIDLKRQSVVRISSEGSIEHLALTPIEFKMLVLLVEKNGAVISRVQIAEEVWGEKSNEISIRTVDRHMSSLKGKTDRLGIRIETVYGIGYRLER